MNNNQKIPDEISVTKRVTSLELVRFIAAISIMLYHFSSIYLKWDKHNYVPLAYIFVEFFFLLSGFFMMKHIEEKDQKASSFSYVLHKAGTFYAAYAVVCCLQFVFFTLSNHPDSFIKVFENLFHFKWEFLLLQTAGFIQNPQFGADYLLGQTWYLSAMLIALLIAYPLAVYCKKIFISVICPISVIIIYSYIIQTLGTMNVGNEYFGFILSAIPRGFAGICMGCMSYAVYQKLRTAQLHRRLLTLLELVCCLSLIGLFVLRDTLSNQDSLYFILVFAAIIILAFLDRTPIFSFLNSHAVKALSYAGVLSLYLYLIHWTVISAMQQFLPQLPLLVSLPIFLVGSFLFAILLKVLTRRGRSLAPAVIICLASIAAAFILPWL